MSQPDKIFFNNEDENSKAFTATLNKRVNEYFKIKGISRYGNMQMYVKTVFMLSLFILPFRNCTIRTRYYCGFDTLRINGVRHGWYWSRDYA